MSGRWSSLLMGLPPVTHLEGVTLQTMFTDGITQNIGEQEVTEWIERISEIQPMKTQIYSLDRPPTESSLRQVTAERLQEIAVQAQDATGVAVEVIIC